MGALENVLLMLSRVEMDYWISLMKINSQTFLIANAKDLRLEDAESNITLCLYVFMV